MDKYRSKISLLVFTGAWEHIHVWHPASGYKESAEIAGGIALATVRMLDQPKETFEEARCGTGL